MRQWGHTMASTRPAFLLLVAALVFAMAGPGSAGHAGARLSGCGKYRTCEECAEALVAVEPPKGSDKAATEHRCMFLAKRMKPQGRRCQAYTPAVGGDMSDDWSPQGALSAQPFAGSVLRYPDDSDGRYRYLTSAADLCRVFTWPIPDKGVDCSDQTTLANNFGFTGRRWKDPFRAQHGENDAWYRCAPRTVTTVDVASILPRHQEPAEVPTLLVGPATMFYHGREARRERVRASEVFTRPGAGYFSTLRTALEYAKQKEEGVFQFRPTRELRLFDLANLNTLRLFKDLMCTLAAADAAAAGIDPELLRAAASPGGAVLADEDPESGGGAAPCNGLVKNLIYASDSNNRMAVLHWADQRGGAWPDVRPDGQTPFVKRTSLTPIDYPVHKAMCHLIAKHRLPFDGYANGMAADYKITNRPINWDEPSSYWSAASPVADSSVHGRPGGGLDPVVLKGPAPELLLQVGTTLQSEVGTTLHSTAARNEKDGRHIAAKNRITLLSEVMVCDVLGSMEPQDGFAFPDKAQLKNG